MNYLEESIFLCRIVPIIILPLEMCSKFITWHGQSNIYEAKGLCSNKCLCLCKTGRLVNVEMQGAWGVPFSRKHFSGIHGNGFTVFQKITTYRVGENGGKSQISHPSSFPSEFFEGLHSAIRKTSTTSYTILWNQSLIRRHKGRTIRIRQREERITR